MVKGDDFYQEIKSEIQRVAKKSGPPTELVLGKTIVRLREVAGLTGAELCRRSRAMDPRTLNAIEKGRIRNPSLKSLQGIAQGLGCLVRDLFAEAEEELDHNIHQGSQRGAFQMDFPKLGVKVVSATPPNEAFFCGKIFLAPKREIEGNFIIETASLFYEVVMGRVEFTVEKKVLELKEGENLFLRGGLLHRIRNALNRESVLWLVASPSFFRR